MAVARSLNQPDLRPPRPLMVCLRWLEFDAAALHALVRHGPAPLLSRMAANRATPKGVLDALIGCGDKSLQRVALRARLRRASTGGDLLQLAEHPLAGKVGLGWQQSWGDFTDDMRDLACVMAVRRSGEGLSRLASVIGDAAFDQALSKAIAHLEHTSASDAVRLELVRALGVTSAPMLLRALASIRYDAASGHRLDHAYHVFERPKRSGGIRHISNPSVALKATQRAVLLGLLKPLGAHEAAFGFVPGRSIVDNAGPHQRKPIVVNADVSNCFPSVRWPLVLAALRRHLSERLSPRAISLLVDLCTAQGGLPIGAPTSPALLNLVLWKTDEVLSQAAQSRGVAYSRYADDLTFSGDERAIGMLGIARRTLSQIGLALDPKKTNVFRRGRRQVVTGLVVNDQVSVPRAIRRRLRAAVHRSSSGLEPHWDGALDSNEALAGRVAFVRMVHPLEGQALQKKLQGGKA
jgi:retron-type reverse transcriptase